MADTLERITNIAKAADKVTKHIGVTPAITSISSQAAKSTYYFPVLVSKNVTQKTATLIATNLEGVYAHFMRACFALTPAIKVPGDVNVEEYLKRFHQNIGISNNKFGIILKEDVEEFKLLPNEPLNEAIIPSGPIVDRTDPKDTKNAKIVKGIEAVNSATETIIDLAKKYREMSAINCNNWDTKIGKAEKLNGMAPTIMPVECTFMSDNHEIKVNIPVGIKTMIHPVDPWDLSERMIDSIAGHGVVRSFVRWTSGEVESLGDMLFGTKMLKKNIAGTSDLDKWFDVIERRTRLNKLTLGALAKKPFLPNMSIHLSIDDVNEIERKTKINILKDPKHAQRLIKECFLLSLIITDDAFETAYILYDGHSDFDEVPYSTVKRESDKSASAIENLTKILAVK